MATTYETVDNMFLGKITDGYFTTLSEVDIQSIIDGYRTIANALFKRCSDLADRDDDLKQYNNTLTDEVVHILSNLMVLEWLRPQIYNIELIKQSMSTKDYKIFSEANHLDKVQNLKIMTEAENDRLMTDYTYPVNLADKLATKFPKKIYSYD